MIVSSSVTVLSDKDCNRSSVFPCSLSALKGCPICGSHTLQSTWNPVTAIAYTKADSELSSRAPALSDSQVLWYNVQHTLTLCGHLIN